MAKVAPLALIAGIFCVGAVSAQTKASECPFLVAGKCINALGIWTANEVRRNDPDEFFKVTRALEIKPFKPNGSPLRFLFVLEVARARGSYTQVQGELVIKNN